MSKLKMNITANYKAGDFLVEGLPTFAKVISKHIDGAPLFAELTLRIVVPAAKVEELVAGMQSAEHVDLLIEGMKTKVEREI